MYELKTQRAGISVMVADANSRGIARALNGWGEKDQSLNKILSVMEDVQPSSKPIDAENAAAAAAQVNLIDTLELCAPTMMVFAMQNMNLNEHPKYAKPLVP